MTIQEPDTTKLPRGPTHHLWSRSRLHWWALLFVAVSAGDLLMTYTLLWRNHRIYESNPIAEWILDRWDIVGMTAFKFGLVMFVVLISETVERHIRRVGRSILILGILMTLYAIVIGYQLLIEHG